MTSTHPAAEPNDRVVLLVEDEVVLRSSMMRGLLKLPRVEVLDAGTVAEALRVTERVRPGVMICDIDLPDGSGIELLAQLERQGKRVPTVFVSAYLPRFRQQIAQRPGVTMLEKPVALSKLREIVVQHLGPDAAATATKPSPFLLTDYVQLAAMGNRSVLLEVLRDGQRVGEVLVRAGQAWHAHDAKGAGVDALMRLMHAHDVTVTCTTPPDDLAPPRTLSGSGEHALLEAARRFDEGREQIAAAFDELFDDTPTEAPPPVSTVPPHAGSTVPPAPRHETFDDAYERGVEALLERDYARAYGLLVAASRLGTSASLEANLTRLRALGFGT